MEIRDEQLPAMIYQKANIQIRVSSRSSPGGLQLLKNTIYGTSGPRYQQTGQEQKVAHITGPYFFDLYVQDDLVATYCLSERQVITTGGSIPGFYGRYLAVNPSHGGKGYGSLLKEQAVAYIERIMAKQPHIFYSYIEEANSRSMRISEKFGFYRLASLEALLFSRLYPKTDPRVRRLKQEELPLMHTALFDHYQHHTLLHLEKVYYQENYFVLCENDKIIAGVQANPVQWQIHDMPGLSGKLIMHLFPHLPLAKRLINPNDYRFVALEAFYVEKGREDEVLILLETVLSRFRLTSALMLLDCLSPYFQLLKSSGKLGMMNKLKKPIRTMVMAKVNGMAPHEVTGKTPLPHYTSAFDYS